MVIMMKQRKQEVVVSRQRQDGFTLVEVLIAVAVMAIGLLAMAQMQVLTIRFNAENRAFTEATTLATGQLEYLKSLPFDPPNPMANVADYWLADVNTAVPLEDTDGDSLDLTNVSGDPDHEHPGYPVDNYGYPLDPIAERYGMFWNIADGVPALALKTAVVTVSWYTGPEGVKKHITFSTVIADPS